MQLEPVRQRVPASTAMLLPTRTAVLTVVLAIACIGQARADEYLKPIGGRGGGGFEAHCPASEFLAGFELHAADDVDAIRPLCVKAYGPREVGVAAAGTGWYGGSGGGSTSVVCPRYTPIVIGIFVGFEGQDTLVVNNIHLFCGIAAAAQAPNDLPAALFDAPRYTTSGPSFSKAGKDTQHCPLGQVAVGILGRSGIWVDAIGLICAAPVLVSTGSVVSSIGKVGPPSAPPRDRPICDAAREARARNSPAAPNLEAQCLASRTVATSIGKKPVSAPEEANPPICERARDARARNSPAAPNLAAQCYAAGGKL